MMAIASALGPSAYWYLTRGTGTVALVLLTLTVVLGILGSVRFAAPRWPRFAIDSLHRDVSLLVIVFLVIHVVTTVLDGFAPITLLDGLIPFASPYRALWLGLGTLSFDLLLALVISSLARRRLGYRSWRAIHWLAYVSWPIAILHTLGTGTDVKQWWLLLLTIGCVLAVVAAVLTRIGSADQGQPALRTGAYVLSLAAPLGIAAFALQGPLAHGWSSRAGTPVRLLGGSRVRVSSIRTTSSAPARQSQTRGPLDGPFSAQLKGRVSQQSAAGGVIVQLQMHMSGGVRGLMRVRLGGQPIPDGGLSLSGSQVALSAVGMPQAFQGQVLSLSGDHFVARVADTAGAVVNLTANLNIDQQNKTVTGNVSGAPAGG